MFVSIKSTNIQDDELWLVTTHGFDLDGALILSTYCLLLIASLYDQSLIKFRKCYSVPPRH